MKPVGPMLLVAATLIGGCQETQTEPGEPAAEVPRAVAAVVDSAGNELGTVDLISNDGRAVMAIELNGLEEGSKAFHLHSVGDCSAPDFKSAGGHLNPAGRSHGKLSEGGKHLGDLPNLEIPNSGTIATQVTIDGSLEDVLAAMADDDGTAVMLHAGPDDYVSDPAGAAGPRIACGVFSFAN